MTDELAKGLAAAGMQITDFEFGVGGGPMKVEGKVPVRPRDVNLLADGARLAGVVDFTFGVEHAAIEYRKGADTGLYPGRTVEITLDLGVDGAEAISLGRWLPKEAHVQVGGGIIVSIERAR